LWASSIRVRGPYTGSTKAALAYSGKSRRTAVGRPRKTAANQKRLSATLHRIRAATSGRKVSFGKRYISFSPGK